MIPLPFTITTGYTWISCQYNTIQPHQPIYMQPVSKKICLKFSPLRFVGRNRLIKFKQKVNRPSGADDQIFVIVRQLWVCWYGAPSPTRGQACSLQLLSGLASAVIVGSDSRRTHEHIFCFKFETLPNWRTKFPYLYVYPRNRVAHLYSQTLLKSKSHYDRRSVGQSVLMSGTHLGHTNNFSPPLFNYF
jgi:hypothetical protein